MVRGRQETRGIAESPWPGPEQEEDEGERQDLQAIAESTSQQEDSHARGKEEEGSQGAYPHPQGEQSS